MAGLVVVLLAGVGVIAFLLITLGVHRRPPTSGESDDGDSNSGGGGGTADRSPPHKPGGGDDGPSWWPEFEREFRLYAARSARDQTARAPTRQRTDSSANH